MSAVAHIASAADDSLLVAARLLLILRKEEQQISCRKVGEVLAGYPPENDRLVSVQAMVFQHVAVRDIGNAGHGSPLYQILTLLSRARIKVSSSA